MHSTGIQRENNTAKIFNSKDVAATLDQIEHSFGATHPGIYDSTKQLFALNFRGLTFYFPVDSKLCPNYTHGLSSLHFSSAGSPIVSKLVLYTGASISECRSPALPLSCYNQLMYSDSVTVLRGPQGTRGVRIALYTESAARALEPRKRTMTRDVLFGDTAQDVAGNLGAPCRIFYKSEDKMKIHAPNTNRRPASKRSDFFFNYFTLGFDVLFDARTQRCRKVILHTNYPGHYNFNMYHRCEFHMQLKADKWVAWAWNIFYAVRKAYDFFLKKQNGAFPLVPLDIEMTMNLKRRQRVRN